MIIISNMLLFLLQSSIGNHGGLLFASHTVMFAVHGGKIELGLTFCSYFKPFNSYSDGRHGQVQTGIWQWTWEGC